VMSESTNQNSVDDVSVDDVWQETEHLKTRPIDISFIPNIPIVQVLQQLRPEIRALKAYDNLRGENDVDAIILDSNENILSPTDKLTIEQRFRYPEIRPQQLIERLANLYSVEPSQIMLGRGSDDIIDVLIRSFCVAGQDAILQTTPCFSMYAITANIQGALVKSVALDEANNFSYEIDKVIAAIEPNTKLIFLASPQSPTGQLLEDLDLIKLLENAQDSIVVVDEAYIDFTNRASASNLLDRFTNLVVMRTLSKAYGLANCRCGAMLAHPQLVSALRPVLTPYAMPGIVVDTVYKALEPENVEQLQAINATVDARRKLLFDGLRRFKWVAKIWNSETNFLLARVSDVPKLISYLEAQNIFIRSYSPQSELHDCVRISIGSEQEIIKLLEALQNYQKTLKTNVWQKLKNIFS